MHLVSGVAEDVAEFVAQCPDDETVLALSPGLFDDQHALVDPVGHPEQGEPFGWLHGKGHHFHLD